MDKVGLIFDMDGVVVNNHYYHCLSWIEFSKRYGYTVTEEDVISWFGSKNDEILTSLFGRKLKSIEILQLGNEKELIYRELYSDHVEEVPGLTSFLDDIPGNQAITGLATSAPSQNVEFILQLTGLQGRFQVITDAEKVRNGKPDPEIFLVTAGKMGLKPENCIVFEDSFLGIRAARSAGMSVVGIATTHSIDKLKDTDLALEDFRSVNFDHIKQILKNEMP